MTLPAPTGELSVENVLYRPDPEYPPLLFDIQFSLSAGQTLAIIGTSGAGKSTLARILVGALPPTLGYIRLDGANIHQIDREILGSHIGYLPQDIQLFDGTIAENIARFAEIDVDKVITAAKIAHVHDLILTLPNGYDTQLGEYGRGLSGG
ncbi:MAG: ATP-binding cassette domain-containing protein [Candidatus Arsenophonus phytopathogenicus]